MSADLFAEFGAGPAATQQQQDAPPEKPTIQHADSFAFFDGWSSTAAPVPKSRRSPPVPEQPRSTHSLAQVASDPADGNDDWGDFEGATNSQSTAPAKEDPFAFLPQQVSQPLQPSQSSQDLWGTTPATQDSTWSGFNQDSGTAQTIWQKAPIIKAKKSADPSVLFDAEDDAEDDDDFGDFEGTETTKAPVVTPVPAPISSSSALVDLLGDMHVAEPKLAPTSIKQDATKTSSAGFGNTTKKKKVSVSVPAQVDKDDSWDTFDDWEASIPAKPAVTSSVPVTSTRKESPGSAAVPAPLMSSSTDDLRPGELPPTNVPPPGVLLSLFPALFSEAQEKLFKPMAAQTLPMRNKLMAEPATIAYLQGYLALANVAVHVVAGRKLRWKRDQHLSQGMRIGPASSRATSGMKLTGIDKGENVKEERETSDVVRAWKEQLGRFRHVVSGVNQIKADTLGKVPDIQETMPVRTLKQSEGGIPARQPCMLCGLKREERVTAADMATDDSFGEWWVDQVNMHRGCRNFWSEHKDALRQR